MSSSSLISTLPSPLPSPTPSIRPSKLELLRLLREQRERGQQLGAAQADSTQDTPAASSVPSTSDSNSLLPSSTPDTTEGSKLNMGAVLGGLAGGVLLLAIILVAIIVPLQRRRSLRNAVTGVPGKAAKPRRRINLDLPWSFGSRGGREKDEEAVGGEGQGEKDQEGLIEGRKTYPTVRSGAGTHRTTGSEVPLLGRNGGGSGDYTPTRSAFGEHGGGQMRLDYPQEARHPAQSSTHLYEDLPLTSPTEQGETQSSRQKHEQQQQRHGKHDGLCFYYRTNSTAAPPVSNSGTVKSGTEQAGAYGVRSDFDPYTPFAGTPSPLDDISRGNVKSSGTFADLELPAPAAAPPSPKKATRDLPLPDTSPFVDVELNDITSPSVAGAGAINSQNFGTGKSSIDIYTCIDNPFMTPLERDQIKPPIPVATTAVGSTRGGAVHGGGSWFSYHSSSVRSGPHIRTAPLPPTFVPPITTSPTDLRDPTRQPSPDSSEPDSASVYSQMSLSRSATAMSVNGSIIRYGSARAQAAENGGSGFMPVVLETKEDTPVKPHFPRDASAAEGLATTVTPASPSSSVEDDGPTPKAMPATSTNTKTTLARMDTLAIGNLIKGRAKRVAVKRSNSDVERIEREGSVAESEGGSDIRRDVATVQQVTRELSKITDQSTDREEDVVVRGRGVRREEVEEAVAYGAIPRVPVKRTSSGQALGRSRSQSRGRLVPKASLQRMRGASSDEGGAGVGNEEDGSSPAKPLIGRSPSKYRPKGLQQRLVEKGLLNMGGAAGGRSRSASRDGNERRVRARTTSVPTPPVNIGTKAIEVKKRVEVVVGRDDGNVSSSAASTPSPSPAKSKGKNKNKKNLLIREPPPSSIDSTLLSLPQERTKASEATESFAANPLTGAFGLGQPPAVRSPATPTFQYAFAELDRVKGFLPKVEGLNVGGSGGKKKGGK